MCLYSLTLLIKTVIDLFSDGSFGLLHFYIRFFFCVFKDVFADCNSVEKEHQGMFYLLKIASQQGGP